MKYFIYNRITNHMYVCDTEEDLIRWFAGHNTNFVYCKRDNRIFDDVAMNYNDVKLELTFDEYKIEYCPRSIIVYDSYDRIIDPRDFKNKILNYVPKPYSYKRNVTIHEFRRGPVSGVHRSTYHRGCYYRHIKTTMERKFACDDEIKLYIRPARNLRNLLHFYDEVIRNKDHSWKAKKIKKQWMKH